jgi:hypothetical protein
MQLLKRDDLVRVGRAFDGGYVISEALLRRSSGLLSFGINDDWSFEADFCRRTGVGCYGFDFSIHETMFRKRGWQYLRFFFGDILKRRTFGWSRIAVAWEQFRLHRSFRRFFRKNVFRPYGIDSSAHDVFKTLDGFLDEFLAGKKDIFLKIDIEGFEYSIVEDIVKNKDRFHALAMEVHEIHKDPARFDQFMHRLSTEYFLYHAHANNYGSIEKVGGHPDVLELSWIRKDLAQPEVFYPDNKHLPLAGIDFPNDQKAADFKW